MKPQSRARYAEKIDRVLRHLEDGEVDRVDLDSLAGVAALSPHHFHRIFRLMTGETAAETVQRLKLARSVPVLQSEGASITEAAGASGYSSSQSYARALRSATGASASELRREGQGLLDRLLKPALDKAGAPVPMPIEIVSLEPLSLLAIRNTGAYSELNRGYEALFGAVFSVLPMEALRGIWGRWHEDPRFTEADQLHFDCAIAVERDESFAPSPPVVELPAAGGRYARLRHVGDYDSLHDSSDRLYAAMIEREDVEIADAPLLVNYVDDPEGKAPETLRSDIYLAVEPAG